MSDPFLGQIVGFAGNFAPRGWAFCQGQLLSISTNTALFSLLGTTYGGDGRTTFGLPDLRGRAAVSSGQGPGLSNYRLGQKGGAEAVVLTTAEMPSHNHGVQAAAALGDTRSPLNHALATDLTAKIYHQTLPGTIPLAGTTITNTGGSTAHNNLPPYLAINWIIALVGTFPSRS